MTRVTHATQAPNVASGTQVERLADFVVHAGYDDMPIEIFDAAYAIIGGGEEGDKRLVKTKEEADHSLLYLLAVAPRRRGGAYWADCFISR